MSISIKPFSLVILCLTVVVVLALKPPAPKVQRLTGSAKLQTESKFVDDLVNHIEEETRYGSQKRSAR